MDGLPWGFKGICACAALTGLAQSDLDVPVQVPFPLSFAYLGRSRGEQGGLRLQGWDRRASQGPAVDDWPAGLGGREVPRCAL